MLLVNLITLLTSISVSIISLYGIFITICREKGIKGKTLTGLTTILCCIFAATFISGLC